MAERKRGFFGLRGSIRDFAAKREVTIPFQELNESEELRQIKRLLVYSMVYPYITVGDVAKILGLPETNPMTGKKWTLDELVKRA